MSWCSVKYRTNLSLPFPYECIFPLTGKDIGIAKGCDITQFRIAIAAHTGLGIKWLPNKVTAADINRFMHSTPIWFAKNSRAVRTKGNVGAVRFNIANEPTNVMEIKLKTGHVIWMGEIVNAYTFFVGEFVGKRLLTRHKHRRDNNTKVHNKE